MRKDNGFSLIEIMIAIAIMTTGLVALAGALVIGVTLPQRARKQEIAKQLANTIMESVIAAKESSPLGFETFDLLTFRGGSVTNARFEQGEADMLDAGPDGVYCTCDDGKTGAYNATCSTVGSNVVRIELNPGPDKVYSSRADNVSQGLLEYRRELIIRDISTGLKEFEVRVHYRTPISDRETVTVICQLTNFRRL